MNSYLVQTSHFKQNPPKEYHSKRKWIAQMREIWNKHKERDESEQNKRMSRRRQSTSQFANSKTIPKPSPRLQATKATSVSPMKSPKPRKQPRHRIGLSLDFSKFRRNSPKKKRGSGSKQTVKKYFGKRRTGVRNRSVSHEPQDLSRNKSYWNRKKKENEKNERNNKTPQNGDNVLYSPRAPKSTQIPTSKAMLLSVRERPSKKLDEEFEDMPEEEISDSLKAD